MNKDQEAMEFLRELGHYHLRPSRDDEYLFRQIVEICAKRKWTKSDVQRVGLYLVVAAFGHGDTEEAADYVRMLGVEFGEKPKGG